MQSLKTPLLRVFAQKQSALRHGYVAAATLWLMLVIAVPFAQAQTASEELIAQKPFVSTVLEGMALTTDKTGAALAVTMPLGINAPLEIVNLRTMKRLYFSEQRSDGQEVSGRAYAVLPNRHVLVGTTGGYVYDVDPDKLVASEQVPPKGEKLVFQAAVSGEGSVTFFLAQTQSGGQLYRYDAQGTWRSLGTVPNGMRGLAYANHTLYVGSETGVPAVFAYNDQNGAQRTLPLNGAPAGITEVTTRLIIGDNLYLEAAPQNVTLVYDLKSQTVVDQKPVFGRVSGAHPEEKKVETPTPTVQTTPTTTQQTETTTTTSQTGTTNGSSDQTTSTGTTNTNGNSQNTNGQSQSNTNSSSSNKQNTTTPTSPQTSNTQTQATTTQTQTATTPQAEATAAAVPAPVQQPHVYFGALSEYDPTAKAVSNVANGQGMQPVAGNCWLDTTRCVLYGQNGRLAIANIANHSMKIASPSPLTGGYHTADMLALGNDDTVYAASSVAGTAVLQVDRDKQQLRKMVGVPGAPASLLSTGDGVLTGTQNGDITRYQTASSANSFQSLGKLGAGSVTATSQAVNGSVAFALTQAGTTSSSGAVGLYKTTTRSLELSPQEVLASQAVASLTYRAGIIYVGGSAAVDSAGAVLSAFDTATKKVVASRVPVPGAAAITSLVMGKNGHLYGVAGATLFEVDSQTLATVRTQSFKNDDSPGNVLFWHDTLIASIAGKVYTVNTSNLSGTVVANGSHVIVNSRGDYYYTRAGALYRMLAPRQQVAAVTKVQKNSVPRFNFSAIDIRLRLGALGLFGMLLLSGLALKLHQRRQAHAYYRMRR